MAKKVLNPRFPHTCKVYRMEGETSFEDGKEIVLYEGECRKYINNKNSSVNKVVEGSYALSLPGTVTGIVSGDLIDVTDRSGSYSECMVTECYAGNLGTTVYFDMAKN